MMSDDDKAIQRIAEAMRQADFDESGEDWLWAPSVYQKRAEIAWVAIKPLFDMRSAA